MESDSGPDKFAAYELLQNTVEACIEQLRNDVRLESTSLWCRVEALRRRVPKRCTTEPYRVALISYLRLTLRMKRLLTQTLQKENSYLANYAESSRRPESCDSYCQDSCKPAEALASVEAVDTSANSRQRKEAVDHRDLPHNFEHADANFADSQADDSGGARQAISVTVTRTVAGRNACITQDATSSYLFRSFTIDYPPKYAQGALLDDENCALSNTNQLRMKSSSGIHSEHYVDQDIAESELTFGQSGELVSQVASNQVDPADAHVAQHVHSPTGVGSLSCVSDDSGICLSPLQPAVDLPNGERFDAYPMARDTASEHSEAFNNVFVECCSRVPEPDSNGSAMTDSSIDISPSSECSPPSAEFVLPAGWRRCVDETGEPYFWHVHTGRTQREPPSRNVPTQPRVSDSATKQTLRKAESDQLRARMTRSSNQKIVSSTGTASASVSSQDEPRRRSRNIDVFLNDTKACDCESFTVIPMGSRVVEEERLDASSLRNWLLETTSHFEQMANVHRTLNQLHGTMPCCLELNMDSVSLLSEDGRIIHSRPLRFVRLWATLENFVVYITLESDLNASTNSQVKAERHSTPIYNSYVVRAVQHTEAASIANAFRKYCGLLGVAQGQAEQVRETAAEERKMIAAANVSDRSDNADQVRLERLVDSHIAELEADEPVRAVACFYVGRCTTSCGRGINALNEAVSRVLDSYSCEQYTAAYLLVTPSEFRLHRALQSPLNLAASPNQVASAGHALIDPRCTDSLSEGELIVRCPLRFLSFFAVAADNVRLCGLILRGPNGPLHSRPDVLMSPGKITPNCKNAAINRSVSQNDAEGPFECYVVYCEPDAGRLCQLLQAACTLRFQKALDSASARARYAETTTRPDGNKSPLDPNATQAKSERTTAKATSASGGVQLSLQALASAFSAFKRFTSKS